MKIHESITTSILVMVLFFAVILITNLILPFPDNNDFYELSRICLLMDSSVKYCVNNNWGFAHPLSCWLVTRITGDLLVAQRLINFVFLILLFILSQRFVKFTEIQLKCKYGLLIAVFFISPWFTDLVVSAHMDIAPICLILLALSITICCKHQVSLLSAGFLSGTAYWFRFHFLSFALLFPIVALLLKRDKKNSVSIIFLSITGVLLSVAIPHILCEFTYGVFCISNQKFVLAQAVGIADWSYQFAQKLETITSGELLGYMNYPLFITKICYHLLKSGVFPFLLIINFFIYDYLKHPSKSLITREVPDGVFKLLIVAGYALISVFPFIVLRGFTYRLEAALVFFIIPLILYMLNRSEGRKARIFIAVFTINIVLHAVVCQREIFNNRNALINYSESISKHIPSVVLKDEPEKIICCVDYYNTNNRYRLCNPMVYGGWGVRFKPLVENFGFLDLTDPLENQIYKKAKYIVLPPDQKKFEYCKQIIDDNEVVSEDEYVLIIRRRPEIGGMSLR